MIDCTELLVLQEHDLELDRLEEKTRQIQEKAARLAADLQKDQDLLDKKAALLKKIQVRKKGSETELAGHSDQLKSLEAKLHNASAPATYLALEKEIAGLKEKISALESKVLEDMEKQETLEKDLAKGQKILAGQRLHLDEIKARQAGELAALAQEKDLARTKRNQVALKIQGQALEIYEDLRHTKKGRIIWDTETSGCPACGMSLPASFVTALVGRPSADHCPYCKVLIRWTGLLDSIRQ
ncbi:MAG: hypothetical protein GX442_03140 [Candidatus Riflebacteria bacterium]|nr:hypothetical protein [Candidatus Riflebacteria bacterium]